MAEDVFGPLLIPDEEVPGKSAQEVSSVNTDEDKTVAAEVEVALFDSYPVLENRVKGTVSDRGVRHADEIVREYIADDFVVRENLIMISIGQLYHQRGAYEAVRGLWRMNRQRAEKHGNLMLARYRRMIVGAVQTQGVVLWHG